MAVIVTILAIIIGIGVLGQMGLRSLIVTMIVGAIGFALGNFAGFGWSIFGAILGGLIGLAAVNQ